MSKSTYFFFALAVSLTLSACTATDPTCTPVVPDPIIEDRVSVVIDRVIDGDTYEFGYRGEKISIRLRMENPKDTVDTFESSDNQRANKQSLRTGLSIDSIKVLGAVAKHFIDSLLTGKPVVLRRYADLNTFAEQFTFGRLLRGVEYSGKNVGLYLRERRLSVESFK